MTWAFTSPVVQRFAPEFYRSEFTSPIADMRNSVKNRNNAVHNPKAHFRKGQTLEEVMA